jgi:type III secretory pathway component EscT
MKYVTMSVVDAMSDVHQAQMESDTVMYAIWREYFTVLVLIFAAPVIFRLLMKDAYLVLVTTLPGQALLVLLLAAVVFSLVQALRLNKPLLS